jgi:hypothetical protein
MGRAGPQHGSYEKQTTHHILHWPRAAASRVLYTRAAAPAYEDFLIC